jgi:hypothetical protein
MCSEYPTVCETIPDLVLRRPRACARPSDAPSLPPQQAGEGREGDFVGRPPQDQVRQYFFTRFAVIRAIVGFRQRISPLLCLFEIMQVRRHLVFLGRHQPAVGAQEIVFILDEDMRIGFRADL